jgi:hypothetical protein
MVSPTFQDTIHTAHTIILALNIQAAVVPQPHSPFLVGWGPAVNNLAQLPTSFIPAAGLCLREKKEISYPVPGKRILFLFLFSKKFQPALRRIHRN